MTEEVNNLCHNKAKIYGKYVKYGCSDADKLQLGRITKLRIDAIIKAKKKYLPSLGANFYWSIHNKFLQKKKIPLIPPIFLLMEPLSQRYVRKLLYLTHSLRINVLLFNSTFDNISFTGNVIISIIRFLNHNKAHG